MRSSDDLQLGELAVKLGYLTTEQLVESLRLQEDPGKSRADSSLKAILLRNGLLKQTQIDQLTQLLHDSGSTPSSRKDAAAGTGAPEAPAAGDVQPTPGSATPSSLFRGLMELPFVGDTDRAAGAETSTTHAVQSDGNAVRTSGAADSCGDPVDAAPSPECVGRSFGRYILHSEIGRGGMGIVWKAWDTELRRYVALKLIRKEGGGGDPESDRETEERFLREAQNAAKLQHAHIVHIYDVGVCEGERYFTMDYLQGEDLGRILERHVKRSVTEPPSAVGSVLDQWPLEERLDILREVASALDHAHSQGIVHRDLKPANIILTPDRGAVVTDFGLAKDVKRAAASGITISGQTMGTPAYMAPEQALGKTAEIGPHSDIFSLGTLMFELLTGFLPFQADNIFETMKKVVEEGPIPPSRLWKRIPRDLETVCLKALSKEPSRRYGSAGEFSEDVRHFLASRPISARRATVFYRLSVMARRNPSAAIAGAAAVLIALVAFLGYMMLDGLREREFTRVMEDAYSCEKGGDFRKALGLYQNAAGMKPDDAAATAGAVRCAEAVETEGRELAAKAQEAKAALEKAREEQEERRRQDEKRGRARVFLDRGTTLTRSDPASGEAVESFSRAISEDPTYAEAHYERGNVYWNRQDRDRAIVDFVRATELDPKFLNAYRDLGLVYSELGRLEEAVKEFSRIGDQDPDSDVGHFARGNILQMEGKNAEAIEAYGRVLQLNPRFFLAYNARGAAKAEMGDFVGAVCDHSEAIKANPQYLSAYVNRGNALSQSGDLDGAIADYDAVLKINPRLPLAYYNRGLVRKAMGDVQGAIDDYTEAIRLNPDDSSSYNNRANARKALGDIESAIDDYTKAIALKPADAGVYANRGLARHLHGDCEEAIADFNEAIRLGDEAAETYFCRGNALMATARTDLAIADYTRALEIDPSDGRFYINRGIARGRQGAVEGALADFRKALEIAPKDWEHRKLVESLLEELLREE